MGRDPFKGQRSIAGAQIWRNKREAFKPERNEKPKTAGKERETRPPNNFYISGPRETARKRAAQSHLEPWRVKKDEEKNVGGKEPTGQKVKEGEASKTENDWKTGNSYLELGSLVGRGKFGLWATPSWILGKRGVGGDTSRAKKGQLLFTTVCFQQEGFKNQHVGGKRREPRAFMVAAFCDGGGGGHVAIE